MDISIQLAFSEILMFALIPTLKRTFKLRTKGDLKRQQEGISIINSSGSADLQETHGTGMRSLGELFN